MVLADYPAFRPHNNQFAFDAPRPEWFRLKSTAVAASFAQPGHAPELAAEETLRTWWCADSGSEGEWLMLELEGGALLRAIQVNFADQDIVPVQGRDNDFRYRYTLELSADGRCWETIVDRTDAVGTPRTADDTSHDYFEFKESIGVRFVRLTNRGNVPANGKFAVSGLRLFGNGGHTAPAVVSDPKAIRGKDRRSISFTWDAAAGADGYIVRCGNYPDSLYIHHQVEGASKIMLHCSNIHADYWFAVDSYNDSGYTKGIVQKV